MGVTQLRGRRITCVSHRVNRKKNESAVRHFQLLLLDRTVEKIAVFIEYE